MMALELEKIKIVVDSSKWANEENLSVRVLAQGYCHYNDQFYRGKEILPLLFSFLKEQSVDSLGDVFNKMNGCWSAIIYNKKTKNLKLVVDRQRSIPLFYGQHDDLFVVSDDIYSVVTASSKDVQFNETSEYQFLLTGFVTGKETLVQNVFQVEPATFIDLASDFSITKYEYFCYFPNRQQLNNVNSLEEELYEIILRIKKRLELTCKDKQVFVPLSGGNDSRLILWMLKKSGIKNVICYTYGVKTNPQRIIAKELAERFNYKWVFIDYSKEKWDSVISDATSKEYWLYASNGVSLPHIQDFPAVKELRDSGLIDDSAIFLPGHVGDAWANEFAAMSLDEHYPLPPQEYHSDFQDIFDSKLISFLVYRHLMFFPVTKKEWKKDEFKKVIDKIKSEIIECKTERKEDIWKALEWVLKGRTSLWIVNSVKTYEYHNASYYLPLADYELINFLQKLPLEHIIDRNLYSRVVKRVFDNDEGQLKKVKILSGGTRDHGLKRQIIVFTKKIGIYDVFERYKHKYRPERNLNFEHWFTEGKRSENIEFGSILKNYNTLKYMPPEFLNIIRKYFNKPSYTIHCNGIFSVIALATFKKYFEK